LLIHGTGREWFTLSLDLTGMEPVERDGTGPVFISIPVSLFTVDVVNERLMRFAKCLVKNGAPSFKKP